MTRFYRADSHGMGFRLKEMTVTVKQLATMSVISESIGC